MTIAKFTLAIFQTMIRRTRGLLSLALICTLVLIFSACGGSSGGGGGAGAPVSTSITPDFLPSSTNVTSNLISVTKKSVQGDTITLDVEVTNLSSLSSAAAFDLVFNPSLVTFVSFAPGTFFEDNGGVKVNYLAALQSNTNNRLVVGVTQQNGAGVKGSGVMIQLTFKAIAIGSSNPNFEINNLLAPTPPPAPPAPLPPLTWVTGELMGS